MTGTAPPARSTPQRASKLRAIGELLTVPNLGLNLFFALAFLLVATHGRPSPLLAVLILLAFIGARNTGHAFNQIVDRKIDAENPRTRDRPLVTGALSVREAEGVVALNLALFLVSAGLLRIWLPLLAVPALALVMGYSYTKRYSALTTVCLGAVQALLPAGVYLAVDGTLPPVGWVAVGALVLFGTAFETVHSLGDLDADRAQGLHSLPLAIGRARAPMLVGSLLAGALALLALYGWETLGPTPWLLMLAGAIGALVAAEVVGLRSERPDLLRLFRLHFAMGGVFLLTMVLFYI